MRTKFSWKIISFLLVIATLMTALPLSAFAAERKAEESDASEVYLKDVKLVRAKTREEAERLLTNCGYTFLDENLNEGTGADGIWMGYQTTTDPTQAIYDMKVMNMKGGFTRTSMEQALASQEAAFAEMSQDLSYLIDEFIEAYKAGSVPAVTAYKALNFFRVVDGERELVEENGLGYQIVGGALTVPKITEILLFCEPVIVDSIVKLLTMGIQGRNENWMYLLSDTGAYDEDEEYMADEEELNRRAEQLLGVLQLYSEIYNTMVKSGLMPDELDENFNPVYKNGGDEEQEHLSAKDADVQKLDEERYKFYKMAFDELAKYPYGGEGKTLKDFFVSLEKEEDAQVLYPLVSVLTDGAFSALSYGCFLEMVTGATSTDEDYSAYDEVYAALTEEMSSVYLYMGVDKVLFEDEAIIGFTDTAERHMASTGENQFFEKENTDERIWEDATRVITCIGASLMVVMSVAKLTVGVTAALAYFSATAAVTKTAAYAAILKYGTMIGGLKGLIVSAVIVALCFLISYGIAVWAESISGSINWDKNPMLQYMYDVKEATFMQSSDDGITTEFMRRSVFVLYEAVTDLDGETDLDGAPVDLNARSEDASQWIQLFVSRDRQGVDAKPIVCDSETGPLRVQRGNGETPEGYVPLTRFGEVIAYDLNQWDEEDSVNGLYVFYKQDQNIAVDDGKAYYISDVQLQTGESDAHCIGLLQDAGYTPLNVNLSPDLTDDDFMFEDQIYTYIGYKTTTSKTSAIRDLRIVYGPSQGSIQYGGATYAACGSNGKITLYATKYTISGTPLMAGGLICVDNPSKAPLGYEPVCLMSGGPAVPVNVDTNGELRAENGFMYLYFLPETTFTGGKQYLGGIAVFEGGVGYCDGYYSQVPLYSEVKELWGQYVRAAGNHNYKDRYVSEVYYYPTYNPYRAVYGIKAAKIEDAPLTMTIEGTPYYAWNTINWGYNWTQEALEKDDKERNVKKDLTVTIQAVPGEDAEKPVSAVYLTGNKDPKNVYNSKTGKMEKEQPIEIASVLFFDAYSGAHYTVPEAFHPVVNEFTNDTDYPMHCEVGAASFVIYTKEKNEERPYVSGIHAVDKFTIYRAYGGYEEGASLDQITTSAMYSYLMSKGATDILPYAPVMGMKSWTNLLGLWEPKNETQFGYTRSAKKNQALRDVFIYFNGFSDDEPPKELYRGSVKYTLLCEIPYNLTSYEDAPKAGVYLYGTTNSKAGEKIIDLQITSYPFMDGYETVRTMNGRSLFCEIKDYANLQVIMNPVESAQPFFEALSGFFDNDDTTTSQLEEFYLHIKRDTDTGDQKVYIENLYLANCQKNKYAAIDSLFDQGAEGYVQMNLNDGAGGDAIYVGYSYTSDPNKAIREIRAYHQKNHPSTLTDSKGRVFELVKDLDLNKDAGGDYIYLYTTKGLETDEPIVSISVGYAVATGKKTETWFGISDVRKTTNCTKHWDSSKNSDLNKGAGGEYVYLMYTTVNAIPDGIKPEKEPNYGKDKTFSKDGFLDQNPNGKYIGGLYVMDKETIRLEKIASGALSASSGCKDITDEEVFARLKAMGATTIVSTPIWVHSDGYFEDNNNKVFIGYSRTDDAEAAIRNIALKAELTQLEEPKESILVNNKKHTLVSEAADEVAELPKAINLLGIEGGRGLQLPALYLYYSTATGNDPIYDLSIDDLPIVNGYHTVRSANLLDAFTDLYNQACDLRDRVAKDEALSDVQNIYNEELSDWMDELAGLFNPEDADVKPFYIHMKRYGGNSMEESKPYIGKIFIAMGDSVHEALSQLLSYEPDGFIEVDLNQDAGGDVIYLGYKRVEKARDALTDLAVYEGKKFEPTRRITVDGESVKYTLVSNIDLNKDAGGKYLYLYSTDSNKAGNPIMSLEIKEETDSYLKCGIERVTVRRANGEQYTDEYIDLNKGAGGDYLYMIMTRETTEGHRSNGIVTKTISTEATCVEDGSKIHVTACLDCSASIETVVKVYKATGVHVDNAHDEDHDCDLCGRCDVSEHTFKGYVEEDDENEGKFKVVNRCSDCGEANGEEYPVEDTAPLTATYDTFGATWGAASLMGRGSMIAVLSLSTLMLMAAIVIYIRSKKNNKY